MDWHNIPFIRRNSYMKSINDVKKLFSAMLDTAEKNFLNLAGMEWTGQIEIWKNTFACAAVNFFMDFTKFSLCVGDKLLDRDCPTYILAGALAHEIGHVATGNSEILNNLYWTYWENNLKLEKYRRGAEIQADIFACKLCALMGYNPLSIGYYLRGVENRTGVGIIDDEVHPCTNRRNNQIIKFCSKPF